MTDYLKSSTLSIDNAWMFTTQWMTTSFNSNQSLMTTLTILTLLTFYLLKKMYSRTHPKEPPFIPYTIPFIGNMISFGMNPLNFLSQQQEKVRSLNIFA